MSTCIVAMFTDARISTDHTEWFLSESNAVKEIRRLAEQKLTNGDSYPTWIAWSYNNGYYTDGNSVVEGLRALARGLITKYRANTSRRIFNYAPVGFLFDVDVEHIPDTDCHFGLAYAQCTPRIGARMISRTYPRR